MPILTNKFAAYNWYCFMYSNNPWSKMKCRWYGIFLNNYCFTSTAVFQPETSKDIRSRNHPCHKIFIIIIISWQVWIFQLGYPWTLWSKNRINIILQINWKVWIFQLGYSWTLWSKNRINIILLINWNVRIFQFGVSLDSAV